MGWAASSVPGPSSLESRCCLGCVRFWRLWRGICFETHSGCWPIVVPLVVGLQPPFLCWLSAKTSLSPSSLYSSAHCLLHLYTSTGKPSPSHPSNLSKFSFSWISPASSQESSLLKGLMWLDWAHWFEETLPILRSVTLIISAKSLCRVL